MDKKHIQIGAAVVLAVAVIILIFFFANPFAASETSLQNQISSTMPSDQTSQATQLEVQDTVVGTGTEAVAGDTLTVNYTGKLSNGTVFDSSLNPGRTPFQFVLGAQQVIPGWDQGLVGMKVGGTRVLIIPPSLGYGAAGNGPVPPNATLTFEVQLLGVTAPSSTSPTSTN